MPTLGKEKRIPTLAKLNHITNTPEFEDMPIRIRKKYLNSKVWLDKNPLTEFKTAKKLGFPAVLKGT